MIGLGVESRNQQRFVISGGGNFFKLEIDEQVLMKRMVKSWSLGRGRRKQDMKRPISPAG